MTNIGLRTIITSLDSKEKVIKDFASVSSVGRASGLINQCFEDYEDFVYFINTDKMICEILFYKSRTAGYWNISGDNIYNHRLDGSSRKA